MALFQDRRQQPAKREAVALKYDRAKDAAPRVTAKGKGVVADAILAKAKECGLVQDGQTMSDHEVFNLIFEAGFSTAKQVSDVSGRG